MASKLAILGGKPIRTGPYPEYTTVGSEEMKRVTEVMESGVLSGFVARGNDRFYGGPMVLELERAFGERFGVKHAISFNSGTSALHGAMIAAGVGPGDEVIVPPYSMSATATAVMMCKAVPVFVDIEPEMFCLDPSKIEAAITDRTRAVVTVNLWGQVSNLGVIAEIARNYGLVMVEDNAQGAGALFQERPAGTVGDMAMFSLNRHKSIQCGEGGVVLTNDDELARRLQLSRNHGEVVMDDWGLAEPADLVGYNYRLPELNAAVAIPQLARLDAFNEARRERAERLTGLLKGFDCITPPKVREGCTHVWYLYGMLYDARSLGVSRDVFLKALVAEGVQVARYEKPIYMLPIFRNNTRPGEGTFARVFPEYGRPLPYGPGLCPVVERIQDEQIMLTNIIRQTHPLGDVDEFVLALEKVADNASALRAEFGEER